MKNYLYASLLALSVLSACNPGGSTDESIIFDPDFKAEAVVSINTHKFASRNFIGGGVQWDPYEAGPISEADWEKLYRRMDDMHPGLIRVMLYTAYEDPSPDLIKILEYCQSRGIYVLYGDWGGSMISHGEVFEEGIRKSVSNVENLICDRGFSCIRQFIVVNEPNGSWSSANKDFGLWSEAVRTFGACVADSRLNGRLKIAGPDAAVWSDSETWWVTRESEELSEFTSLYDMHYYPGKEFVNSGEFSKMALAYAAEVPSGMQIVLGEVGFKQTAEDGGGWYAEEAARRVAADPYASAEDSQMFVFDYFYGTDMADIAFQTINAGYSGCVAWMLDDAMHFKEKDKLKVWGFWNILGEEKYGADKEKIRPWYYAWSLICRYIPAGSDIYKVTTSGKSSVKAVSCVKDGKRTIALVNVSKEPVKCVVASEDFTGFKNVKEFIYNSSLENMPEQNKLNPLAVIANTDLHQGIQLEIGAETMIVLSEM